MAKGRPKKHGLTRMDAALEAMATLGFPRQKVERFVKDLLKEYGGNQGWRFIEEDSYLVLIDALLRDAEENDQENVTDAGNQAEETLFDDVAAATTSAIFSLSDTQQDERPENNVSVDVVGPSGVVAEEPSAIPASPKRPNTLSPPPRKRPPCYGWIDSDDEETLDYFIRLKPAPVVPVSQKPPHAVVSTRPSDCTQNKRTRKTRWDVKPDDP